jgi:hypothetical protein
MCPLKDPTFIMNKAIQERVIQHNNLYGKINKNYNKNIDIISTNKPSPAVLPAPNKHHHHPIRSTAHSALSDFQPSLDSSPSDLTTTLPPHPLDENNDDTTPSTQSSHLSQFDSYTPEDPPIVHTEHFDIPTPPIANTSTITNVPTSNDPTPNFTDLIFDPVDYLHYSS